MCILFYFFFVANREKGHRINIITTDVLLNSTRSFVRSIKPLFEFDSQIFKNLISTVQREIDHLKFT